MKILFLLLIAGLVCLIFFQSRIEAQLPVMNVSIEFIPYYYIVISDRLWEGIFYTNETGAAENIQYPLISGTSNNNAIWNYNKSNRRTEYWVLVGGNIQTDICHGATNHLCSNPGCEGADNVQIDIGNAKWASSLVNDGDNPSLSNAKRFIIGFDNENKVSVNTNPDTTIYLRYWLDIPPATPAKAYNTTYQIMVVPAGESCV